MRLEDHGSIAHLVLDMPGRTANVWNQESLDQFSEYLEHFRSNSPVSYTHLTLPTIYSV